MKKVIFDTDIGIDDAMALLFLHYSPDVDLRAASRHPFIGVRDSQSESVSARDTRILFTVATDSAIST